MSTCLKWSDVAGFPGYRVSADGEVQTQRGFSGRGYGRAPEVVMTGRWRSLKCDIDERGRKRVTLSKNNLTKRVLVSRLVLECFAGPCPAGMVCCHNNGDCTDNRIDNLRWDTQANNLKDKISHGTHLNGEKIHTAKLTEDDVRVIRSDGRSLSDIAEELGVTVTSVLYIKQRKTWKHVV